NQMRMGTTGYCADDLTEDSLRHQFFGEPITEQLAMMGLATTGIEADDLAQCFELPNEVAEAVTRLLVLEALVGGGRASRIIQFELGPRTQGQRRLLLEWEDPVVYRDEPSNRRAISGDWISP
ncbi:MAG: hypothetical protein JWM53_2456, partial [bacterium]|nr:hypothetical protein [bacterium]